MQKNYNENLVAGAAIRDDKGRRISKLFEASHPKMTVGYAKNLIMPNDPTEQEFNFRQAGGGVIEDGVAVIDKVKGKSLVWNQLVQKFTQIETTLNGLTFYPQENGEVLITGVATENTYAATYNYLGYGYKSVANHKAFAQIFGDATRTMKLYVTDDRQEMTNLGIVQWGTVAEGGILFIPKGYDCGQGVRLRFIVNDLTKMFGAGNEPSTYEEFLQRKPFVEDEFAYNEGTIVNNKVEKVVTTGRNLFDSSTAIDGKTIDDNNGAEVKNSLGWCSTFIPIIGGETYFCKGVRINIQAYGVHYYDKDKQHINVVGIPQNGMTFDAPINAKYIRIHGLYDSSPANTAILNLSDPTINGQYFPYEKHELDLSWVKEIKDGEGVKLFEDGMKSAGTTFDEVGKNKAVKRIRKYVFDGSEPISEIQLNDDGTALKVAYYTLFETTSNGVHNAISVGAGFYSKYNGGYYFDLWAAGFAAVGAYIICVPSSVAKTSDEMKEYLKQKYDEGNPLVVYYELAEPIEVEYDEKNLTYPVVAGGTEEAIASEPSTAFRADIGYGIDAVKTILDLKARVEALEGK